MKKCSLLEREVENSFCAAPLVQCLELGSDGEKRGSRRSEGEQACNTTNRLISDRLLGNNSFIQKPVTEFPTKKANEVLRDLPATTVTNYAPQEFKY